MMISWLYPTLTSNTVNVSVGRKSGKRMYVPGSPHDCAPEPEDRLDPEREPDHAGDLVLRPDLRQHPREQLEQQAHERPEHEQAEHARRPARTTPSLHVQPVEDVRRHRRDGAVGEVEDARRLVREHEPGAGKAVHRAGGEADDDERKKFLHASDSLSPHATR